MRTATSELTMRAAAPNSGDAAHGWYLYGITRGHALAAVLADAQVAGDAVSADDDAAAPWHAAPLQVLECAALMAVVRPVPRADFTLAVLRERLRSAAALEATVRHHNRVIEAIHARQPILPARFGTIYGDARAIVAAMDTAGDALSRQLQRLEACDEWAVHLYADRAVVRAGVAAHAPALGRLRDECSAARPGRAFFLERQIRDELEGAMQAVLSTVARDAFDRLAAAAVAAQVNPAGAAATEADDTEILRAAFLVRRDDAERFDAALRAAVESCDGLRGECTGPWPPYSFALDDAEEPT